MVCCIVEYYIQAFASKCHFFLSHYQHILININGSVIESSNSEKLLGITIDSDFTFEEHINTLCRKASQKLYALSRITQYLSQHQLRILFKTFMISQLKGNAQFFQKVTFEPLMDFKQNHYGNRKYYKSCYFHLSYKNTKLLFL